MKEKRYRLFKVKIFISTLILSALMGFCFERPIWASLVGTYHCSNIDGITTGSSFFETHWSPWSGAHSDGFCLNPGRLLLGTTSSYYGSQGTACYTSSSLTESMDNQRIVMGGEYTGNFKIILWCPGYHRISFDHGNETYSPTFTISDADENNFNQNSGYPLPGGARYFERHRMMYGHKDGHTISKYLLSTQRNFCYLGTPFNNRHLDSESLLFKNNGSSGSKNADNQKFLIGIDYTGDLKYISWYLWRHPIFCDNNDNNNDFYDNVFTTGNVTSGNNVRPNPGNILPGYSSFIEPQWIGWADTYTHGFNPVRRPFKSSIFSLGTYNSNSTHYCQLEQKWTQANNTCSMVFTEKTDNLKFVKGGENANNLKFIEPLMVKKDRECFNEIDIT
jgi:hypothetical protein